jgi:hypothetical protein
MPSLVESSPCPERCPICRERCYGNANHTACKTAGRGMATLHQCRRHVWADLACFLEFCRAQTKEIRREYRDELEHAHDQATKRIRKALGLVQT